MLDRAAAQIDDLLPGAISQYRQDGSGAWSGSAGIRYIAAHETIGPNERVRAGSIIGSAKAAGASRSRRAC